MCSKVRERKLGLFDQLVRKCEQRGRHGDAERLGDLNVDDQLELSRLLDGEVGGLGPLQDLVHEGGSPPDVEGDAIIPRKTSGPPHPSTHEWGTWPAGGCWQPRR